MYMLMMLYCYWDYFFVKMPSYHLNKCMYQVIICEIKDFLKIIGKDFLKLITNRLSVIR